MSPDKLPHIHRMEEAVFHLKGKQLGHPNKVRALHIRSLERRISEAWRRFRERTDVG